MMSDKLEMKLFTTKTINIRKHRFYFSQEKNNIFLQNIELLNI